MKNYLLLVSAAVLLAGCAPAPYKPTPIPETPPVALGSIDPKTFFPTTAGKEWTYTMDESSNVAAEKSSNVKLRIADSQDTPGGRAVRVEVSSAGAPIDAWNMVVNDHGVFQKTSGLKDIPYSPMQPLVLLPLKEGQTFDWKGTGICPTGEMGSITSKSQVLGSQAVDIASGRMSGIAVETDEQFTTPKAKGTMVETVWYRPTVGIIRLKQISKTLLGKRTIQAQTTLMLKGDE